MTLPTPVPSPDPTALSPAYSAPETSLARVSRLPQLTVSSSLALLYLTLLVVVAVFAPYLAPHNPSAIDLADPFHPPSLGSHLLGTDQFGHDELSQLIFGTRYSLLAALIGTSVAVFLGTPLGMLTGYLGRRFETALSFFNDSLMAIPSLILVLAVIAVIGKGLPRAMLVVGIVFSPPFFRLARAATKEVKEETFIEASRSIGCAPRRTLLRHIMPNALTPIIVQASFAAGASVAAEAGLSFLGLGVVPPSASWGTMLMSAGENLYSGPYLVYFPGVAIALTVLSFFLLGDWLRDGLGAGKYGR